LIKNIFCSILDIKELDIITIIRINLIGTTLTF